MTLLCAPCVFTLYWTLLLFAEHTQNRLAFLGGGYMSLLLAVTCNLIVFVRQVAEGVSMKTQVKLMLFFQGRQPYHLAIRFKCLILV